LANAEVREGVTGGLPRRFFRGMTEVRPLSARSQSALLAFLAVGGGSLDFIAFRQRMPGLKPKSIGFRAITRHPA
jgi:hypothetical protein